jgi:hypothetical protein
MERSVYSAQPGLPSIENKKAAEAAFGWFDDVELTQAGSVFGTALISTSDSLAAMVRIIFSGSLARSSLRKDFS